MKLVKDAYGSWNAEVVFITSNYIGNSEMMEVRARRLVLFRWARHALAACALLLPLCACVFPVLIVLSFFRDARKPASRASELSGTS